jgi:hypothetical protein
MSAGEQYIAQAKCMHHACQLVSSMLLKPNFCLGPERPEAPAWWSALDAAESVACDPCLCMQRHPLHQKTVREQGDACRAAQLSGNVAHNAGGDAGMLCVVVPVPVPVPVPAQVLAALRCEERTLCFSSFKRHDRNDSTSKVPAGTSAVSTTAGVPR